MKIEWIYSRFCTFQITENLLGVNVTCAESLSIYEEEKNANFTWTFIVKSRVSNGQKIDMCSMANM